MKVILEGCDLVGKSTAALLVKPFLDVQDRLMEFSHAIEPDRADYSRLASIVHKTNALFVILLIRDEKTLMYRLEAREQPDNYDLKCIEYNRQYVKVANYLNDKPNVVAIEVDGMNRYQKAGRIIEEYIRFMDKMNGVVPLGAVGNGFVKPGD